IVGAIILHGGHHVAQESTSTGRLPAERITSSNVASVSSRGCPSLGEPPRLSGALQRPHRGWRSFRVSSTRLFAPQLGHVTRVMAASILIVPCLDVGRSNGGHVYGSGHGV